MTRRFATPLCLMLAWAMLLAGCAREKVFTVKSSAQSINHKAVQPASKLNEDWWAKRHQGVLDRVQQGNVNLILVGDSITHGWENHPDLWKKYFEPRNAVNMGFSGDCTQHVLWRFEHGELAGITPKAAMVMIGTNNSNGDEYSAEEIADGIIADCRELRARLPQTKILLLAIFPRNQAPCAQREKNAKASLLASRIADDKHIYYLNINQEFLQADGTLSKEIMPDYLHPNAKGYELWLKAVLPKIDELLQTR